MAAKGQLFVRRSELLWALSVTDDDKWTDVADWLGFEGKEEEKPTKERPLKAAEPPAKKISEDDYKPEFKPKRDGLKPNQPSYFRVKDRERDSQNLDGVDEALNKPEWYTEASPTFLQEHATRVPAVHRVQPILPALLPWPRLYRFLQRQLGNDVPGHKPDIPRLIKSVINGQQLRLIPRLKRFTWSPKVRLLIDINQSNFPYRKDYIQLRELLSSWRGTEGLSVEYLCASPGGKVSFYSHGEEQVADWSLPDKDESLLILSDLSLHSKSRRELYQWLAFGETLALNGVTPTVLLPVAERAIDKQLLRFFRCIVWDRNSDLRPIQVGNIAKSSDSDSPENLLSLLSSAIRVDLGLLRSVRLLLPAELSDVTHESSVWSNPNIHHAGDEWGWQDEGRKSYSKHLRDCFSNLSNEDQAQLVFHLGCHHAQLPDELYFEVMYELIHHELPVPEAVKEETRKFMADMVKTYDYNPDHQGLDLWVKRYLLRHAEAENLKDRDQQIAFMAIVQRRIQEAGGDVTHSWPKDIPLEKIHPFLNQPQEATQRYLLRQKGQQLELIHAETADKDNPDWGAPVTLLEIYLKDSVVFSRYISESGESQQISIDLVKGKETDIPLPDGIDRELVIGSETLKIDAGTFSERPKWIVRQGMEGKEVWAESQSLEGSEYRWFWHPPEWNVEHGLMRGVWFPSSNLNGRNVLKSSKEIGRDEYGIYADVEFSKKANLHRFRWIEPNNFMMGSPEEEENRADDETLHEVTLSQGYWLAETVCTQELWEAVMSSNPSKFIGTDNPVDNVSFEDASQFIEHISKQNPHCSLRLPTEAEWENACRSGTSTSFNFGDKSALNLEKVNYSGKWADFTSDGSTKTVKHYDPNKWGVYEMHGNVLEWCQDLYSQYPVGFVTDPVALGVDDLRVLRGGSWGYYGGNCRSANRYWSDSEDRSYNFGFRLALGHEQSPVRTARDDQQRIGSLATGK